MARLLEVHLTFPYPVSANRYWQSRTVKPRGGASFTTTYVTAEAKKYKLQVEWSAVAAGVKEPMPGRVAIEYWLYPHRPLDYLKRMRADPYLWDDTVQCLDLDNVTKVLLDSLKGVVMGDDKNVFDLHGHRMEPDEHGARLVVTVKQIASGRVGLFADQEILTEVIE